MSSTALFGMHLCMGPHGDVDVLPHPIDEPTVFVPSQHHYLHHALEHSFPQADIAGQSIDFDLDNRQARRWAKRGGTEEEQMGRSNGEDPVAPKQGQSRKRPRQEEGGGGGGGEAVDLHCELIYSQVEGQGVLGTIQAGLEPRYYDTLAVVALLEPGKLPIRAPSVGKTGEAWSYEERLVEAAWKQKESVLGAAQKEKEMGFERGRGIVLGHIVPCRIKDTSHPLTRLHPLLLRHGWIKPLGCVAHLRFPFLPNDNVIGPTSSHPIGRAVPIVKTNMEDAEEGLMWQDPVTKHVWNACPRRLLPAPELLGTLEFAVHLTSKAMEYGDEAEHDGFVEAPMASRRSLNLSAKLKPLIVDTLGWKDGLVERQEDQDGYWGRTPRRYYDVESAKLAMDNRIETALESTRPGPQAVMREADGRIKTSLMPFQKRALAWMRAKEVEVREDEGALLPHWISLRAKPSEDIDVAKMTSARGKRQRLEEPLPQTIYMDTVTGTLSRRRFTCRQSEPGGCLCDAMGLGKSLTALSLIESHQREASYVDQSRSAQMVADLDETLRPFASSSTLLVVPSSLVHQWYSEISKHLAVGPDGDGYILRFQRGLTLPWTVNDERKEVRERARKMFASEDGQAVVVLATYEDLRLELQHSKRSKTAVSPLLEIQWWRVMLDEAQLVSTSNGNAAEMVNCLWRTNGWIITSTPFNASIRDMHGLLTFLDSDFASKKLFEELIAVPFVAGEEGAIYRAHCLLKRIMWRHCKEHVKEELGLPPSTLQTLYLDKTGLEKSLYDREYKQMLELVRNAVGLGKGLTKKQRDRLLSLRRLISHPQLATALGYGGPGSHRSTFANLFADLIFRNQGELYNAQMELIVVVLKVAAGERFKREEKETGKWKGGAVKMSRASLRAKLKVVQDYARQGLARDAAFHTQEARRDSTSEGQGSKGKERDEEGTSEVKVEEAPAQAEGASLEASSRPAVPASMRYEEALHWIDDVLSPSSSREADAGEATAAIDPERLTNLFFEKKVTEAGGVDLDDTRYHPVLLDAGDEEEDGGEEGGKSSGEAVLLKNRFRGTSKRNVKMVWFYAPRKKLQSLCNEVIAVEAKIAGLQGEANYLENRIREELGEERARLVMKEGFDALGSTGSLDGQPDQRQSQCVLCMEQIDIPGILPCLHSACFACLTDCVNKIGLGGKTPCPMCRQPFERSDIIEVLPAMNESDHANEFGVKITGLVGDIRARLERDPDGKIVFFSAWSTYLSYVSEALNNLSEPILSVAFSGKGQSQALQEFERNPDVRIILVPMKMAEGAAGLTLNISNVAYLLEPSLDAALEDQALGRLNRIGQKASQTTYVRVLVRNTIEPALVQVAERRLRERKDSEADTRHHDSLSVDELAFVFGLNVQEEKARKREEIRNRPSTAQRHSDADGEDDGIH